MNTKEQDFLTVGELIERLKTLPSDAIVMLECDDSFYTGPVCPETQTGEAILCGPKEYLGPAEDHKGRPIPQQTYTWKGGWILVEENSIENNTVINKRPAFILRNT